MRQSSLFKQKLFAIFFLTTFVFSNFSTFAQTRRRAATVKKPANASETKVTGEVLVSATNQTLAQAWQSGQLPPPLALPAGSTDEVAKVLAQKIAAKDAESVPALLTALQLSGFFITNKDGSVYLAPPDGKGQGLTINGWEIASAAKMFGENKQTTLKDLNDSLKAIPLFSKIETSGKILDGLRLNAENTTNPFLRVWARFVIELGKNSADKYDILSGANAESINLDAIQNLLILRRLYGDLFALAEKYKTPPVQPTRAAHRLAGNARFVNANFSKDSGVFQQFGRQNINYDYAESVNTEGIANRRAPTFTDEKQIPCKLDGDAPIVLDLMATAIGYAFGQLIGSAEEALSEAAGELVGKYGSIVGNANILLAYAKFLQTYAVLETTLTLEEGAPLVRTKNSTPGARKNLKAVVSMNIGSWQMYNCFRTTINLAGIDFATVNDGPAGGIGVTWHLDEGGGKDVYSNSGGLTGNEQIVGFTQGAGRIQDGGTSAGVRGRNAVGNATYTKTDGDGVARIILEGSPQKNAKIGKLNTVMKQAKVRTTVKMKAGDLKGESVDVTGQVLGGLTGLITMPLELLYRMDWASTASLKIPVQDWEECDGGWYGTVTYTASSSKSYHEPLKHGANGGSEKYSATAQITVKGDAATAQASVKFDKHDYHRTSGTSCCLVAFSGKCKKEGTERINKEVRLAIAAQKSGKLEADAGGVYVSGNAYHFNFSLSVPGSGKTVFTDNILRECMDLNENKYRDQAETREYPISVKGEGAIDPKNPDVIAGSKTVGDVTITWNLKRCR